MGTDKKNLVQSHASSWQERLALANAAPRCHARRKFDGKSCCQAAVKGKTVCRMHGGKAGAPKGNKNRLLHGLYAKDTLKESQKTRAMIKQFKAISDEFL